MPRPRLLVLFAVLVAGAAGWKALTGGDPPAARPVAASFPKLVPAKNPATLQLQADDRTVHGWISGPDSHAGETVRVVFDTTKQTATVAADNTFAFPYEVTKPQAVTCTVGKLWAALPLSPRPAAKEPTAFVVVDRTAYRPGQTLNFVAFLRQEDEAGEFAPTPNAEVEVRLTLKSEDKNATTQLDRRADAFGRVVGSYTFTDADTLGEYEVTVAGHVGSATVLLAEYRKSQVRLKIAGTTAGTKATLTFDAVDFLDKPIAADRGSFVAQVVRRDPTPAGTLNAAEFARHDPRPLPRLDFDDISEDDLLFHEAETAGGLIFTRGRDVVAEFRQELKTAGDRLADATIDLRPDWLGGGFELVVDGVVTDATGREQRATETVAITPNEPAKKPLDLTLPRTRYTVGDAVEAKTAGVTVTAMKLAYQVPSVPLFAKPKEDELPGGRLPGFGSRTPAPVLHDAVPQKIRQTPVAAAVVADGKATLTLAEPGAYRLIAFGPKGEKAERTILVKRPDDGNPFELRLDKREFAGGDQLTGWVRSRYADAKALLTLRDSRGIVWAKPIMLKDGAYRVSEECPPGLRYGCTLDVLYPEDGTTRTAHADATVVPADRLLVVKATAPDPVAPGSTVKLDLSVNRQEPVDLIVSVYDRSLLAIQPDTNPNVRNFYHADDRAAAKLDRELLRRKLGTASLFDLREKIRTRAKDPQTPPAERNELNTMLQGGDLQSVALSDLVTLLRAAGIDVYLSPRANHDDFAWSTGVNGYAPLVEAIDRPNGGVRLGYHFVGNTLLLQVCSDGAEDNSPGTRWHPVLGWDYGEGFPDVPRWRPGFRHGFGLGGFGGGFAGGFGGGGLGGGLLGGGAANNLGNGGSLAGIGGGGPSFANLAPNAAATDAASPDAGEDLRQLPDLAAGVAIRRNFADTAYWNAAVRTDASGHATVSVKLPDTLTRWQVVVTAVSPKMHVGGTTTSIGTFQPVMVWPMLPRTFTEGDVVQVFASVHNRTDAAQTIRVKLKADNGDIRTPAEQTVLVGPKANAPVYWTFAPTAAGEANLLMTAAGPAGSDAALKRIPVARCAAEQIAAWAGFARESVTLNLPKVDADARGQLELVFAPSLVADVADTLGYLVEYPYGCVEQTMSRFLPAVKVSQIQKQLGLKDAALEEKLPGVAAAGIKRLTELQYPDGSWGWWGSTAPDPLMTAYALYGLSQADAAGYKVDADVLVRGVAALKKLLENQERNGPAEQVYGLYVLSHRGKLEFGQWVWLENSLDTLADGSVAFVLEMAARNEQPGIANKAAAVLKKRAKVEHGEARWETAGYKRWADDKFEVTAAALKALVAWDKTDPLVEQTIAFFAATKRGNRWNSTKDTAMILFALCDYLGGQPVAASKGGNLKLTVAGRDHDLTFDGHLAKRVVIPAAQLTGDKVELKVRTEMKGVMYRAVFRYWKAGRDLKPVAEGLTVERRYTLIDDKGTVVRGLKSGDAVPRGSFIRCETVTQSGQPDVLQYLLVENPKPGGCETMAEKDKRFEKVAENATASLREDRDAKVCFHHERAAGEIRDVCVFRAELAGEFVAAPAVAELMYHPTTRGQSATFVLTVK